MFLDIEQTPFGIDISDLSFKLVQLKLKRQGLKKRKVILSSYSEIQVPNGLINQGDIQDENKVVQLLQKLIKNAKPHRITSKRVISVLPEPKTFIKLISLTPNDNIESDKQLKKRIIQEAQKHIPLDLDEAYIDFEIIDTNKDTQQILFGAAPKQIVDKYTSVLEKAGLIPIVLEIEASAIVRCLLREYKKDTNKAAIAFIDLGATRTGFIIFDKNTIQLSISLPTSGERITNMIAKELNLSTEKAEALKRECGLDEKKCKENLKVILLKNINELVDMIQKSINFYQKNFPTPNAIEKIILCGGGANLINIDKILQEKLAIHTEITQGAWNIVETEKGKLTVAQKRSFTTATGLALRWIIE